MSIDHSATAPLDGNAAAALFAEMFAPDITAAELDCGTCGAVAAVGAMPLYGGPMGAILRCAQCDTAVLCLTRTRSGLRLEMHGARKLFVAAPAG
jgi:hypothetical protein